jgi:PAS domain S-box-containing protein
MAQWVRTNANPVLPEQPLATEGFVSTPDELGFFAPIINDKTKEKSGVIFVRASFQALHHRLAIYALVVSVILLLSLLITFLVSARLVSFLSDPILALAKTAKSVSEQKDNSVRAEKKSSDELGALTDSFNQMLEQIQEQDAALRKSNEELERRVQERTRELQYLQHQNELILNSAGEGIYGVDLSGQITFANPAAAKATGWSVGELAGRQEHATLHFSNSDGKPYTEADCPVCASFREGKVQHSDDEIFRRKSGAPFHAEFVRTPLIEKGKHVGAVVLFKDISERKQAEDALAAQTRELARSNAELEQFAYVASHDLQEPLRMVSNYTQLLARRYKNKLDSDANEFIAFAVDGAIRMQGLINDLLMYSRVGTKGKKFRRMDCSDALGQAIVNLRSAIEESQAIVMNEDLPILIADSGQLVQLFQNLIANAIKFHGSESPRVHISAERQENAWLFSVRDNGIGIDPQYAERIFIIFQRLHGHSEYPGTGIGLSICKKIVDRHGGRIWVESQVGQGANFFFTIPIHEEGNKNENREDEPD